MMNTQFSQLIDKIINEYELLHSYECCIKLFHLTAPRLNKLTKI